MNQIGNLIDRWEKAILVCVIALSVVLGIWRVNSQQLSIDAGQTDNFWPIVDHLLDGEGYTLCYPLYFPFCPGQQAPPTAMREPVPVLLFAAAAFVSGRSLLISMHVQVLLAALVVLLTYRFVRRLGGPRAALFAALGWALYLPALMIENQLSADLAGTFFLMWSACALQSALEERTFIRWALTGSLLGLAVLSRSSMLLMLLPWSLAAFYRTGDGWRMRSGWKNAAALGGMMLLVLSPWMLRNKQTFGKAWPGTSMNGYNFWRMNSQVGTAEDPHYVDSFEADTMMQKLLAKRTDLRGNENEAEMDHVYLEEGLSQVKKHPVKYVRLCGYRLVQLLTNWRVKETYGVRLTTIDHVMLAQQLFFLLLAGIGLRWRHPTRWIWLLAIGVQLAGYSAFVGQMRYVMPIMPFFLAFAALALSRLLWGQKQV